MCFESIICATREESLLGEIQADELHLKMQDPTFAKEAQLIDVREPDEVYALFLHFTLLLKHFFFVLFFEIKFHR